MTTEPNSGPPFEPAAVAKRLLRETQIGALGTLGADGAPNVSLVSVAADVDGAPVLLLSGLARHTRNLLADSRASLLLSAPHGGDPLQGARLSVAGRVTRTDDATARRRYLARHPEAAGYAGFADFAFYRIEPSGGYLVAGFGRIVELVATDIMTATADAASLLAAEESAVAHMNEDHADAVRLYATRLLGAQGGEWRLVGIDPEGCDLMADGTVRRLDFPRRAASPAAMRTELVELAQKARTTPE